MLRAHVLLNCPETQIQNIFLIFLSVHLNFWWKHFCKMLFFCSRPESKFHQKCVNLQKTISPNSLLEKKAAAELKVESLWQRWKSVDTTKPKSQTKHFHKNKPSQSKKSNQTFNKNKVNIFWNVIKRLTLPLTTF